MFALDTETTGIDLIHGCEPFYVSTCDQTGKVICWEWDVDPLTRKPMIEMGDTDPLIRLLENDEIVCHNANFDLKVVDILSHFSTLEYENSFCWEWDAIQDTMVAVAVLRNLYPSDLKSWRQILLLIAEDNKRTLRDITYLARGIASRKDFIEKHGEWMIAGPDLPTWPATHRAPTSGWWVCDTWLPRAIATNAPDFLPENYTDGPHPWLTVLSNYAKEDAITTLALWEVLEQALHAENLFDQYQERLKLISVIYGMETSGVSLSTIADQELDKYQAVLQQQNKELKKLETEFAAKNFNRNSPTQLRELFYETWKLPVTKRTKPTKTHPYGQPSTDYDSMAALLDLQNLDKGVSKYLEALVQFRRGKKSVDYLSSYRKWSYVGKPKIGKVTTETTGLGSSANENRSRASNQASGNKYVHASHTGQNCISLPQRFSRYIYPTFHLTGTKFTRQSSSNPNLQNVGTGKEVDGEILYNLRYSYGPTPGRIWASWDYSNIELRIWGYDCGNAEFLKAFKNNLSVHLIIARELHPYLSEMSDDDVKKTKDYKRTKNGDFAIIYGSSPGKADTTYGVRGAYNKIAKRFPEVRELTSHLHHQVMTRGYIETLTGYRLYIPVDDPHKAVSGRIQGTAGAIIGRAMVGCDTYLKHFRSIHPEIDNPRICLQVHDELVFDLPEDCPDQVFHTIEKIMEAQGDTIGIPLPVSGEVFTHTWGEGIPIQQYLQQR